MDTVKDSLDSKLADSTTSNRVIGQDFSESLLETMDSLLNSAKDHAGKVPSMMIASAAEKEDIEIGDEEEEEGIVETRR
jgi:Rod binding domain-containing protein